MRDHPRHAKLVNRKVVACDLMEWAGNFDREDRKVNQTEVGPFVVSTVFLGLNHGFGSRPMWFETMVFGSSGDEEECERYETYEEAEIGHEEICVKVRLALKEQERFNLKRAKKEIEIVTSLGRRRFIFE